MPLREEAKLIGVPAEFTCEDCIKAYFPPKEEFKEQFDVIDRVNQ